jgi:hypothetical protein
MLKSPRIPAEHPTPLTIAPMAFREPPKSMAAQELTAVMLWAGMVTVIRGAP